ncbi:MAG: hypothetical protein ACXVAG_16455 [Vulcanimicrobiaceae bacterium]
MAKINWTRALTQGAIAGIAGGILIDLFIYVTSVLPQHGSMIAVWQFIASTAVGKEAFASASYAWLGVLIHFIVSIAWATGYAYLAQTRAALNVRPAISGIAFGVVVYVVMQIVLVGDNNFRMPSPLGLVLGLIGHCVFFGLPVAYAVRAQSARA